MMHLPQNPALRATQFAAYAVGSTDQIHSVRGTCGRPVTRRPRGPADCPIVRFEDEDAGVIARV
jgi:hypothetical protein